MGQPPGTSRAFDQRSFLQWQILLKNAPFKRPIFFTTTRKSSAKYYVHFLPHFTWIKCLYHAVWRVYGMHMQRFTDNLYHGPLPDSYLLHCVWSG